MKTESSTFLWRHQKRESQLLRWRRAEYSRKESWMIRAASLSVYWHMCASTVRPHDSRRQTELELAECYAPHVVARSRYIWFLNTTDPSGHLLKGRAMKINILAVIHKMVAIRCSQRTPRSPAWVQHGQEQISLLFLTIKLNHYFTLLKDNRSRCSPEKWAFHKATGTTAVWIRTWLKYTSLLLASWTCAPSI